MEKRNWAIIGIAVLILIAGGIFVWEQQAPRTSTETIRIGAILGLTGESAEDSLNIKRGIDLAVDDLKQKGIVVDVNYQDDKTDPKQTISALQFLFANYQPDVIMGPSWSFLESAAAPLIKSQKIIAFAPANTSEFADVVSPYQFQGAPRNALIEAPVARWLKENNKKRVAILVAKDAWGESNKKGLLAAAKDAGATVVFDEELPPFTADVSGQTATALVKIKALQADVLLWDGYEQEAVTLAKKRLDLKLDIPVIAVTTVYANLLSRNTVTPAELSGMYYLAIPVSPDFIAKFQTKYGQAPGNYADRAYDGTMILADALQHAPAKDADTLAQYLRTHAYTGYGGTYEFNEQGDVKGGEWVIQPIVN